MVRVVIYPATSPIDQYVTQFTLEYSDDGEYFNEDDNAGVCNYRDFPVGAKLGNCYKNIYLAKK